MKTQKTISFIGALLITSFSFLTLVQGYSEDEFDSSYEEVGFDSLVSELSKNKVSRKTTTSSTLDDVEMHMGLGMITASINIEETFPVTYFKEDPEGKIEGDGKNGTEVGKNITK